MAQPAARSFFPPAAQLAQRSLPSSFPVWASPGPWPTQHFPRSSQCPAPPRDRSHHPGPTSPQPFSTQRPSNARPRPTTREARSTTRLTRRANLSAPRPCLPGPSRQHRPLPPAPSVPATDAQPSRRKSRRAFLSERAPRSSAVFFKPPPATFFFPILTPHSRHRALATPAPQLRRSRASAPPWPHHPAVPQPPRTPAKAFPCAQASS